MYISLVKIAGTDSRMCWKIILDFIKFTHLSWLYSAEFVDLVWVDRCSDIFEAEFHDLFSKKNITNFGFKNFKALTFLKKFMECIGRRWIYSQNRDSWFWAGYCHSMLTLNQFWIDKFLCKNCAVCMTKLMTFLTFDRVSNHIHVNGWNQVSKRTNFDLILIFIRGYYPKWVGVSVLLWSVASCYWSLQKLSEWFGFSRVDNR